MSDVFTKRKRSEVMSRIRGRGNKETEIALRKLFRRYRITGWRRNQPLLGKPDFVFSKERVAVFVDGCFWHGCPTHSPPARWLRKSSMQAWRPRRLGDSSLRTGKAFWRDKLAANIRRDRFVNRALRRQGWTVVRIWEHELRQGTRMKDEGGRRRSVEKILKKLNIER
jgi:DNA mismatch endonuclease (patch repair protein)